MIQSLSLVAQKISGTVKDAEQNPLVRATIGLLNAKDSSVIKWSASKSDGVFEFTNVDEGKFLIVVSHINFEKSFSDVLEVASDKNVIIPTIVLKRLQKQLQTVVVISQKPIIEVKADKTIMNIEGTINATGSDALELLRKSPGVLVDKDDNLSLNGKNGVQIYIDGRPSPLTGKDLSEYLKSIQSSQIEAIEIITNPSARYDAAGNAGIINIKLKKNKAFGTNGSLTAGYAVSVYSKYNTGLSFNHRKSKVNVFGNYNFNTGLNCAFLRLERTISDTFFANKNDILFDFTTHNFKMGADYFINKKSTFGVIVNGVLTDGTATTSNRTPIIYKPSNTTNRVLIAGTDNIFARKNVNTNLNYRYADSTGKELNIDADYGYYKIRTNQFQPNYYYDATETTELSRSIYRMIAPSDIYIYTFKTDFSFPFKKGQLSIGTKIAFINSKNDFQRYDVYTSNEKYDSLKSNYFNYKENINAGYINYNKSFKGIQVQFGLRMENTVTKGHSTGYELDAGNKYVNYDSTFTRNYVNLFPSASIIFNKNPASQWSLTYSRRIDRPTYQSLNPFEFRLDEYTYQKGNTQLRPQYTNSFGISHIYKYKLTTGLNYSHVQDVFAQIIDTAEKSKTFLFQKNLAQNDIISFNVTYPFQKKWFSSFFTLRSYYSHYKANLGIGRMIDLDVYSASLYIQASAKLDKGWTTELSGFYNTPSLFQGTFKLKSLWSMDFGVQKVILKGKVTIRANVTDLFQTMRPYALSNFAGQKVVSRSGAETRQFKMNITYRFGSSQVKTARQRQTGADEEKSRVQQN